MKTQTSLVLRVLLLSWPLFSGAQSLGLPLDPGAPLNLPNLPNLPNPPKQPNAERGQAPAPKIPKEIPIPRSPKDLSAQAIFGDSESPAVLPPSHLTASCKFEGPFPWNKGDFEFMSSLGQGRARFVSKTEKNASANPAWAKATRFPSREVDFVFDENVNLSALRTSEGSLPDFSAGHFPEIFFSHFLGALTEAGISAPAGAPKSSKKPIVTAALIQEIWDAILAKKAPSVFGATRINKSKFSPVYGNGKFSYTVSAQTQGPMGLARFECETSGASPSIKAQSALSDQTSLAGMSIYQAAGPGRGEKTQYQAKTLGQLKELARKITPAKIPADA